MAEPNDKANIHSDSSIDNFVPDNMNEQTRVPLHKKLFEAAKLYLRQAGIDLPYATLEVTADAAILHGAAHGSAILVCSYDNGNMINQL
jgi:hypothetical protein